MSAPALRAVISDFGGVLTSPLIQSFMAFQNETGIGFEPLGRAMQRAAEGGGGHPLYELEKGGITEQEFIEILISQLEPELGHRPEMHTFREVYFKALEPNEKMIELLREAKAAGFRMAMLTNNVREWEPLWRSMLPVDEIFELVVDSAFVGMRKPDPEIYELTIERLGGVTAPECLFIDDLELNCEAARGLGMRIVHYRDLEQATAEVREALGLG